MGACKRSGEPPDPGTKNASRFPSWTAHDPNAPETHVLRFHHDPLRLGPLRHIRSRACQASAPPPMIVTSRSIGTILILSSDTLTESLVAAPGCLGRAQSKLVPTIEPGYNSPSTAPDGTLTFTARSGLGMPRPVSSNGPLFRRDDSLCRWLSLWTSRRNTGLSLGGEGEPDGEVGEPGLLCR